MIFGIYYLSIYSKHDSIFIIIRYGSKELGVVNKALVGVEYRVILVRFLPTQFIANCTALVSGFY